MRSVLDLLLIISPYKEKAFVSVCDNLKKVEASVMRTSK